MKEQPEKTIHELTGTVVISLVAGTSGAAVVAVFMKTLYYLSDRITGTAYLPGFLIPLIGASLTGLLILRFFPGAGGDGTNSYIQAVNKQDGRLRGIDTVMKIPATLITLGFYGSGGIVGTLSRVGAGLSSAVCTRCIPMFRIRHQRTFRIAAVCGVSAVVSTIFYSPLGGALFASEITRKNSIIYTDLFPAILTGCVAVYASSFFGQEPVFAVTAPPFTNRIDTILLSILSAVISGGVGILFIASFNRAGKLFGAVPFKQPVQAILSGIILSLFWAAGAVDILGTSLPLFSSFASWNTEALNSIQFYSGNIFLFAGLFLILKMAATSITVGSGLSGGVTGPLIIMGTCSASMFCAVAGVAGGSIAYYAVLCACISAILSSALNIPIAATLIAVAIFDHSYIIPAVVGSVFPFFIYKGQTVFIYSEAEEQGTILNQREEL